MNWADVALFAAAIPLGIYAVAFGGGMFLAIPLFQALQPAATVGAIVAAIKTGSLARGLASTWATRREIRWRKTMRAAPPFLLGAAFGALAISDVPQAWLLPLVIGAIALSEGAPWLAKRTPPRAHAAAALATGVYGGVLGAGIGVLLVGLLRVRAPADQDIVSVKIEARYLEFLMGVAALAVHATRGDLSAGFWGPWALGSALGGLLGGMFLSRLAKASARTQRLLLLISYAVAVLGALMGVLA